MTRQAPLCACKSRAMAAISLYLPLDCPAQAKRSGQIPGPGFDLARRQHEKMIGHAGGGRGDGSTTYSRFCVVSLGGVAFRLHLRRQNHRAAIVGRILCRLIRARRGWARPGSLPANLPWVAACASRWSARGACRRIGARDADCRGRKPGNPRRCETITSAWLEIVNRVDRTAEGQHRALVGIVAAARLHTDAIWLRAIPSESR